MLGRPVDAENRPSTGVTLLKCWAEESSLASADGVKVPATRIPLPCAMRRVSVTFYVVTYVLMKQE